MSSRIRPNVQVYHPDASYDTYEIGSACLAMGQLLEVRIDRYSRITGTSSRNSRGI